MAQFVQVYFTFLKYFFWHEIIYNDILRIRDRLGELYCSVNDNMLFDEL